MAMWTFYYLAILYLASISFNADTGLAFFLRPLRYIIGSAVVFYLLMYWIWPTFLAKKKRLAGVLLIVAVIIFYAFLDELMERFILMNCAECLRNLQASQKGLYALFQRGTLNTVLVRLISAGIVYQLFVFLAFPVGLKIIFELLDKHIATLQLQRENIQLEFNFLKAQVSPHFMFNTLNNIYALILSNKKEQSAETVSRLSTFLRYTLYEANGESSSITKEIELLKAYISLEQIRLDDITVNSVFATDENEYQIPPLLFIPAVENAFKYCSPNNANDAYIFMKLEAKDNQGMFRIVNTYDRDRSTNVAHGGIGLENLRRRLQHHYPGDKSVFEIEDAQGIFTLTIQLKLQS